MAKASCNHCGRPTDSTICETAESGLSPPRRTALTRQRITRSEWIIGDYAVSRYGRDWQAHHAETGRLAGQFGSRRDAVAFALRKLEEL